MIDLISYRLYIYINLEVQYQSFVQVISIKIALFNI